MDEHQPLSEARIGRVEVGIDCIDPAALAPFWALATGYAVGDFDPDNTYLDLVPTSSDLPVIYFQRVPEEKFGKNRVHLDLHVKDIVARTLELEAAGAARVGEIQTGSAGGSWQVMLDPAGNEFCLCAIP